MAKRCWDVVVAALGLAVLAPLLLSVALVIYLADGRPILFRQRRVGWRGRLFHLYKFRTMRMVPRAESGTFDAGNCSRVTRIGRLLRRTKLDELPQLWNVVRGDMSLVGPRPEVATWVAAYPERWALVHQVRPGITDPASIVYRDEEELLTRASRPEETYRYEILPHKLSLYEAYIRTRTFWGDLCIIFQTAVAVLHPHPAKERT
ncbi:MAG: sugar transferase [Pirellulaceae bacterium]